jgi:hypothetical protein
MSEQPKPQRTRVTVDVWRRELTDEERDSHERLLAKHPEINYLPIDAAWGWRVDFVDDPEDAEEVSSGELKTRRNEAVPEIIAAIRRTVSVELAFRFRDPIVPLHPRLRRLLEASPSPDADEVARCLAALLKLKEPASEASRELLVLTALIAQGWYDDPWAAYDELALGYEIASRISSRMSSEDFSAALKEFGVKDEVELAYVAARLVKEKMGFTASSRS